MRNARSRAARQPIHARTVIEDGRLFPCVLRRGRLDEPLERELNARGNHQRRDAVLGHLEHLWRLVLDHVEAGAAITERRGGHV